MPKLLVNMETHTGQPVSSGSGGTCVFVTQAYVPSLQTRTPSYGVNRSDNGDVIVCLSLKAPQEVLPLLRDELNKYLQGFVPTSQNELVMYAERITQDCLTALVVCGNLRLDKVSDAWRWID